MKRSEVVLHDLRTFYVVHPSVSAVIKMDRVAIVVAYAYESSLVSSLREQGFEVFSIFGRKVIPGMKQLSSVSELIEATSGCDGETVVIACGLEEIAPSLDPLEQEFYSLLRRRAGSYSRSVLVVEQDDLEIFRSLGFKVGGIGIKTRRELGAKAFLFTSDRDRGAEMALRNAYGKNVLVIGSGGREHALATKLSFSDKVDMVYVAPGNGGTSGGKLKSTDELKNADEVEAFANKNSIDLVVVGPEQPLIEGITDELERRGISVFGPSLKAARLEASKAWMKDFFQRHSLPTAKYRTFSSFEEAKQYIEQAPHKVVVKASGIAAGKGVLMPQSTAEAVEAARTIMVDRAFGEAGAECVVEMCLQGEECSVLAFCDGQQAVTMPAAQDHKRAYDNDEGPNTGGMGAFAPAPCVTPAIKRQLDGIMQSTVEAMAKEGAPFKGCLFAGFMLTEQGPMLLEYNCRFGDPEAQVLMPLLDGDLFEIMQACAKGRLRRSQVSWVSKAACTVVCAAPGYPGPYPKGIPLAGLDQAQQLEGVTVHHAGTSADPATGALVTSGGRVVAVTGVGASVRQALSKAYSGVAVVAFEGKRYRSDVGRRAAEAPVRIGILSSTRGSSLQPVIDAIASGELRASIEVVVSDKSDSGILDRAAKHRLWAVHVPATGADGKRKKRAEYDAEVTQALQQAGVQLVLMIGYMRIASPHFIDCWRFRCLNVHPSLLPAFAGGMDLAVHKAVIEAGKRRSGCTVHFVTEEVDGGPVVCQAECDVREDDTPESLKARVQALEGACFISAIEQFGTESIGPHAPGGTGGAHASGIITYADAGVNIDAGESLVQRIKPFCKATQRAGCDASLGGFGGLFDLAQAGYESSETVLVSGTDGVGTKLKIAQSVGRHDSIGIDLVAMCVNDILVCGAEPLFFLDYYACGHLDVEVAAEVVRGIAAGCAESGCALIGGETAEMAGMYTDGEYDLAGFSVGAVRKDQMLPRGICAGDALIALPSSGVHSNGYSLVRRCVARSGLPWDAPCPFGGHEPGTTLGAALLCPTRLYVKPVLPLLKQGLVKGMAHITGGGLTDNIPRVLPPTVAAVLDFATTDFSLPPVFRWLQTFANLPQAELLRTFNCGIGMVVVVEAGKQEQALALLQQAVPDAFVIGKLVERQGADSPQVVAKGELK